MFLFSELNETTNENGDTVGQIVDYIMKNEGMSPIYLYLQIHCVPTKFAYLQTAVSSTVDEYTNDLSPLY